MSWKGVDPAKWAVKAMDNSEEAVRAAAIKYFSAIIQSSPVDEGTFRANWYVTTTSPSNERDDSKKDKSGSSTASAVTNFISKSRTWNSFIFTNNMPYSEVIEFGGYSDGPNTVGGYSKQAPQGIVRVNAIRFNALLEAESKRVN